MIVREPEFFPPTANALGSIGRLVLFACRRAGQALILLGETVWSLRFVFTPRARREVVDQMFVYGIRSLGVITIVAVFTGMILALQTGIELRRFNQEVNIGTAVMVSMLREMGPFMTGLILAACVGSAMAAQIGTMTVNDEIASLEIMSIDPVRYLMTPRLAAMMVMTPILSFYTCMLGVLGGGLVGMTQINVPWDQYIKTAMDNASTKDLFVGLFKALLFGLMITVVSCYEGFTAVQGAMGVGRAVRRSVITSFLLVLIVGYFVTRFFYLE